MNIWNPDEYTKAWNFASIAHHGQVVPGSDIPYINHIGNVAMEAMTACCAADPCGIASSDNINKPNLLIQCALLHDVIEDTDVTYQQIKDKFGVEVAEGVLALSKNKNLPSKLEQMNDSINRIQQQPPEIWMVKLSDRITNLQPPPKHWHQQKINNYRQEAILIAEKLGKANQYLAERLKQKIIDYGQYLSS